MRTSQRIAAGLVAILAASFLAAADGSPVKVTIEDEKEVVVEAALPIDPTPRVRYTASPFGVQVRDEQNRTLHLSHYVLFKIDDQVSQAGAPGGNFEKQNQPLPRTAGGRTRQGFMSLIKRNDMRITMMAELSPTKPLSKDQKRELGTMLVRYLVENTGQQPRRFGLKVYIDTYIINNDGALFAAPNFPKKVLNGIELKDKTLPPYVQVLERPDLANPGYVAHLTLDLGGGLEKASRVVLSSHGAGGFNGWDMPAVESMGDSALAVFFDPKELKPGGKREFAYAYGKGVAVPPESEGRVEMRLSGSFELGKSFTINALVHDPVVGQALVLELPKGMALMDGREIQPVPVSDADPPQSVVQWKCRVLEHGRFPVRLRSSTGVTHTKIITVAPG